MSNPEIFHVIGYTRDSIQSGGLFRPLWLSNFLLQQMQNSGRLTRPTVRGRFLGKP